MKQMNKWDSAPIYVTNIHYSIILGIQLIRKDTARIFPKKINFINYFDETYRTENDFTYQVVKFTIFMNWCKHNEKH